MAEELTKREQEVVIALCSLPFRTQEEVAEDLGISARTLRAHVSNVLTKLGLFDQRDLVLWWMHKMLEEQLEKRGITKISRRGERRRSVVVIEVVKPISAKDAIDSLSTSGVGVYVMTSAVEEVLDGLDVFIS